MTPRTPRSLAAALLPLILLATGACTTSRATGSAAVPPNTPPALAGSRSPLPTPLGTAPTPTPSPSPTPAATSPAPTHSPRPTASTSRGTPTPSPSPTPTPRTLEEWIARIPQFPAAPKPVPVTLSHGDAMAAWQYQIPTSQRVAFLTIDDGVVRKPEAIALLRAAKVPVTLFLTIDYIQADPDYFRQLEGLGAVIESHTVSHPHLPTLTLEQQKSELCESTDRLASLYGRRPLYFRPPFGERNDDTLRAAWECGLLAGFHWRETVNEGIVRYQRTDHRIYPGDIILMHFRPAFEADFVAALEAIHAAGLTPALLENYVHVDPP